MPTDSLPPLPSIVAAQQTAGSVILTVIDSESVAKRIESYLRNAGHPVRTAWVTDIEDVEETLRRSPPDMVLCADGLADAPLADVITLCARLAPDLPVVLLSPSIVAEDSIAAMAAGARDHVSYEDLRGLRHLELVALREFAAHRQQRELRATRKRLENFESLHHELLSATNDAVAHILEGIVSDANPAFAALLGYDDAASLAGVPLMDLVAPGYAPKVKEQLRQVLRGKTDKRSLDCSLQHREGASIAINARLTVTEVEGEQMIEMLIRSEAEAAATASVDHVNDRLQFFERLEAAVATTGAQQSQPHAQRTALLVSIDHFAALEERIGLHDVEQTVVQLSDWLKSQLQADDSVFRFSTSELAVIATFKDGGAIEPWGDKFVADTARRIFSTAGHEAQLSLTVVAYPFSGSEKATAVASELVATTRKLSAQGGKQFANIGATAANSLQERELRRQADMVRKALVDDRLKLAYQSIASLEGDTRHHYDVLVRLIDPEGREVHASEFIAGAEKTDQMRAIDRWVTARSLKMQAKRDGAQDSSSLFIKLSEDTLKDSENFVAWLRTLLENRPLRNGELVFQLREKILQNHVRKAKLLMQSLMEMGAQTAIEHFGAGPNSAQLIEHLPLRFIKFDQSFAKHFGDKDTQKRMSALMEQAKARNIKVIVSHIEDANLMARLWQMGVNFIQGYHVQEPEVVLMSADVGVR
ncbi:EAL domain-containing response regulator [Solimonas marina]|uniref:EAL domain-containing protein n=1 Tax=Solimonas marina TaxID=2714601 RepID=A0A970B738_9GAMM|nr:EAL domain-containing protein [Solimonas marina]NKF23255.1 EAL domain-containing protein [Solimonas marina]